MTLPDPPKKAKDRHFGTLTARWEGLLERGNRVKLFMAGGWCPVGRLKQDSKGYVLINDYYKNQVIYFEAGDVVAIEESDVQGGEG